ncbi:4Fe-4S binding protein [Arcobacter sp. FWKO B]|uniref:4Fe-4S binding protein n=1 Tax=Arcobacter sp. FWKO B TaxID=2593672 RepID=UPI0019053B3F|nr:4Fe-4S binding protein [Arcobacter sp. FWKO B]
MSTKSIKEMGWDELVIGAAVYSFEGTINYNVAEVLPEDRHYAETNSKMAYVGDWRVFKPVWNSELCIDCQNCWLYCPDTSIISRDKKMVGVDYDHCKGCGICVEVCPTNPKSLLMFAEQIKNEEALTQWPEKTKGE